ncbi:MAG: MBL fold metallo-hydrolase [Pseudomonadales bacterium]|nr:MBL fold metallo-hydrolase [Pseudomonadales bacterium]MDP4875909.1 MBL fold metallo-hydrolase [Pseudomonadales bacterium]MDP5058507.1 MBL fold metallo-hydrolase [Pseudomonadales bacterium]
MRKTLLPLLPLLALLWTANSFPHNAPAVPAAIDLDELAEAFGWDFTGTQIRTEKITDDFFVLFGAGGNIGVSIGKDGVFIVDDQFPQLTPKIHAAIGELGGEGVDFAVNTHWHFDHAEGNKVLGAEGTWLVAQQNSRQMMQQDNIVNLVSVAYDQQAYPQSALPDITFADAMQFHLNGQTIDLMHFGPAHTTGDTAVYFHESNVLHMGDVFNNAGYPFIDAGNGGTLEGLIHFCEQALKAINADTVVIPGHGPVTNYQALADYVTMLTTVRDRMLVLIHKGASLDAVFAARPTADFDGKMGDNVRFINRAYMSLTHKIVD